MHAAERLRHGNGLGRVGVPQCVRRRSPSPFAAPLALVASRCFGEGLCARGDIAQRDNCQRTSVQARVNQGQERGGTLHSFIKDSR